MHVDAPFLEGDIGVLVSDVFIYFASDRYIRG